MKNESVTYGAHIQAEVEVETYADIDIPVKDLIDLVKDAITEGKMTIEDIYGRKTPYADELELIYEHHVAGRYDNRDELVKDLFWEHLGRIV